MKGTKAAYLKAWRSLAAEVSIFAAFMLLTFTLVLGIHIQKGNGMYPAIKDGDILLYYRTHDVMNTEAVVYSADGGLTVGRVAACEGTKISITGEGQMVFAGSFLPVSPDNGIYERTYAAEGEKFPLTVEAGSYFILGDNRGEAEDSREYGQIYRRQIKGRIISVIRRRQI